MYYIHVSKLGGYLARARTNPSPDPAEPVALAVRLCPCMYRESREPILLYD